LENPTWTKIKKTTMNGKSTQIVNEIKKKVKNPITKKPQFSTTDMVIEMAVQNLYTELKLQKLI